MSATRSHISLAHTSAPSVTARVLRGSAAFAALVALAGGVPWALVHYIGWPLPGHVPSWDEIEAALTTPMSASLLLNVLAVLCWLAWAVFVVDVARTLPGAVRAAARGLPRPTAAVWSGPVHALAAVLVTTVAVALLAHRPTAESAAPPAALSITLTAADVSDTELVAAGPVTVSADRPDTVVVREPRDGMYDCLWRIADRALGDGARWPEIYRLNHGRNQADGKTLTHPNLIHPGWVLVLPDTPQEPVDDNTDRKRPAEHADQPTATAPTASPPSPITRTSPTPAPSSPAMEPPATGAPPVPRSAPYTPATPSTTGPSAREPGIDLGIGVFVGLGIAAAISAALLVVRRRQRRWYQPASGHRTDLPVAPIVRTLQLAHLRHTATNDPRPTDSDPVASDDPGDTAAANPPTGHDDTATRAGLPVGVRDGHQVALDLAGSHGLGLIGPGADAAARALLVGLLTAEQTAATQVLLPEEDAVRLLDRHDRGGRWPFGLRVVASLDAALNELEGEIVHRARLISSATTDPHNVAGASLVLVATPEPASRRRLQAVLDNGSTLDVAGVLLDQWRPGATAHVRADGTVAATNPGTAERLRGTRLFTLPAAEAADVLALLHDAGDDHDTSDATPERSDTGGVTTSEPRPRASPADIRPATTPVPVTDSSVKPGSALTVTILGQPGLACHPPGAAARDITGALSARQRELVVYLALHPDGVTRDTLADALWPDTHAGRPLNALHTALSRLRRALRDTTATDLAAVVTVSGDRYRLNPELVDIDYRHFADAVHASRTAASKEARAAADRQIIDRYHGELAAGLHADWLEVPREAARRDAIDAAARLARHLAADDPQQTLHLLETARGFDPYNEFIYRDIMRLQARLGQHDAVSRTLALLIARLAELDEQPDPATVTLAGQLQRRDRNHDQPGRQAPQPY